MILKYLCSLAVLFLCLFANVGCATLINSADQNVAFNTDPPGATVSVDGVTMGTTPCVLPIARKGGDKQLMFAKPGYKTVMIKLDNVLSASLAGNILFGGFIGLGVDAISGRGGGYKDSVSIILEPGTGSIVIDPKAKPPQANPTNGGPPD